MRIVSGVRPSGDLHVGNYIGAIRQFLTLQETHECFFFIADLHALTDNPSPEEIKRLVTQTAVDYLALGLDPQQASLFIQSAIPAHTEAMWLFTALTPVGELERMTQYKEKTREARKCGFINAGLFNYPVLMAADILLYRAEGVPIGDDQKQHLELARRTARRFNERYGALFPEPQTLLPKTGARIMSLSDPRKKMSKSHGPDSYIGIFDEPDAIRRKVKRAVTDSGKAVSYDPKRKPALANLLEIYALAANEDPKATEKHFTGKGYADLKTALAQRLTEYLTPFRERRRTLLQSPAHVRAVLEQGAERARAVSGETLREMRMRMGLT